MSLTSLIDSHAENKIAEIAFDFKKIINYQKSHNSSNSLIKSLLEEEYIRQRDLAWKSFNKVYPNLSEQDKTFSILYHYTLIEKLDLAYINACTMLNY